MVSLSRHPNRASGETFHGAMTKLLLCVLAVFFCYFCYSLRFASGGGCLPRPLLAVHVRHSARSAVAETLPAEKKEEEEEEEETSLRHVAFGIAASARLWPRRKEYIKQWWRAGEMRGAVWLDEAVEAPASPEEARSLPPLRVSAGTEGFRYRNREGHRSAIRISRIAAEAARESPAEGVRWFVMGDDDTVFVAENLVRVLRKYDHRGFYYIGGSSESHVQNIHFSYKMAYGGGGFAVSAGLAAELAKMQDGCLERYPELYGSDGRVHACLAELGVPLTTHPGFHQFDVYGSVFGLLAAHPVTPLVSLHHLDIVKPIFPKTDRVAAIKKLTKPMGLDSAALAQQSICYDRARNWTVSVSWGYAVQIFRGVLLPREVEIPGRTFTDWYRKPDHLAHAFNTRPYSKNTCQTPFVYYLSDAKRAGNRTLTRYGLNREAKSECKWKTPNPSRRVHRVEVYKTPDPHMWDKAPRRNCCRILPTDKKETLVIDVGECHEGEFAQF